MKFSVSKDKLLEGLSTVQNVVSTRTTLPILSNVLLQASDGEIRMTTTDMDTQTDINARSDTASFPLAEKLASRLQAAAQG